MFNININLNLLVLATLSAPAFADLMWSSDNACSEIRGGAGFNCGLPCTPFGRDDVHSVMAIGMEPNNQVVLYKSTDCTGDAYAAIGQAYGSSVDIFSCVPSTTDSLGSFEVLVYNATGGGDACPPGTLTAASTSYPAPTG